MVLFLVDVLGNVSSFDIQPGPGSSWPSRLTWTTRYLMFSADDGVSGEEPWYADWIDFTSERVDSNGFMAADRVSMEAVYRLAALQWLLSPSTGRPGLYMMIVHSIDKAEHAAWSQIQKEEGGFCPGFC